MHHRENRAVGGWLKTSRSAFVVITVLAMANVSFAQPALTGRLQGHVTDETGGWLPGVMVRLRSAAADAGETVTDASGEYSFDGLAVGSYELSFSLINFASLTRRNVVVATDSTRVDAVLSLSLSADVTVIGKRIFANLADVSNPAENLVGVAQSATQGAITARQLDVRPLLRQGEVLETVPGLMITQHSGEGKANQYFLRGFNLDHGSDFAMTVAGTPVNMPTHAHSQGYADINFLIPELVAGVQFSKGPYFADQGDFATAGASNINYATSLDRSIMHIELGSYDFGRVLIATSPKVGKGHFLVAFDASKNAGPWAVPDDVRKFNGVVRYSQGDTVNGFSITGMGYHGEWNATEASPQRAVDLGLIDRFGTVDPTDRGATGRYSLSGEWQQGSSGSLTKIGAYGLWYNLDLIFNFTFYLDDPTHGDQVEQVDDRFVTGFKVSHRLLARWHGRVVQNTIGLQVRNDSIPEVALYHTEQTRRLETRSLSSALVTSAGAYAQNEVEWSPWLRTLAGARIDGSRYRVNAMDPVNSGTAAAGLVSPKGGATFGPWKSTELYVNGGSGFHSNNALGTTITRDGEGNPVDRVTPLVRAAGAETGVRTVVLKHLQTTASLWWLHLGSELVYNGDAGATEPGPASRRQGWRSPITTARPNGWSSTVTYRSHKLVSRKANSRISTFRGCRRRGVSGCERRWIPPNVRQPSVAVLRAARARRGQLRTLRFNDPGQSERWLRRREKHAADGRRVQSVRREGQRHRVLLHVTSTQRAAQWSHGHSFPSRRAPHRSRRCRHRLLRRQSWLRIVPTTCRSAWIAAAVSLRILPTFQGRHRCALMSRHRLGRTAARMRLPCSVRPSAIAWPPVWPFACVVRGWTSKG
jgi:Carboxypeptidase regulatory-like domain/TonB-dependent Receptor Plug Domain/TonB dependent receptor-like, beta-barrel